MTLASGELLGMTKKIRPTAPPHDISDSPKTGVLKWQSALFIYPRRYWEQCSDIDKWIWWAVLVLAALYGTVYLIERIF